MSAVEYKQKIKDAIESFTSGELRDRALNLFEVLGYNTSRSNQFEDKTYSEFKDLYVNEKFSEDKALVKDWSYVDILFQVSKDEVTDERGLFDTGKVNDTIIESYLFFTIALKGDSYSRTQLSNISREVNKLFPMPVMILFKYNGQITVSIINRRINKKDGSKDVLEKVTLIKDINISGPHRAHVEILYDLSFTELQKNYKVSNFVELHNAWQKTLDTKELNKRFYQELSNWYFWAMDYAKFPDDVEKDESIRNATNLIRLITRIIFIWFIKEKGLVPDKIFNRNEAAKLVKDLCKNNKSHYYYNAILQNLFFGTLNQNMKERKFTDESPKFQKGDHGIKNLYRYIDMFLIPEKQVLALFADVPFLNGGLFDCLDKEESETDNNKVLCIDGFSRNEKKRAILPDFLFFADENEYDLNEIFGTKNKKYKVRGLIEILSSYKFTITENTPIEEEIALDPELLGKVFENLLASYNPETSTTARKQTGSFYTPREIVNYMVDESLIAYFDQKMKDAKYEDCEDKIRDLISYSEEEHKFDKKQTEVLICAIDNCKILDPACGSGAFPMGILHKLVHVLHKIDPKNEQWKKRQLDKLKAIDDPEIRDKAIEDTENAFEHNELDYGRKLYLIENCIYGVDIQPIAVQIAKLRFFISLIIDQKRDDKKENHGIRSLPNLETKFVAANTLIGLEKPGEDTQLGFKNPDIDKCENELKDLRHKYFTAKTRKEKRSLQDKDKITREKISKLLINDGWGAESAKQIVSFNPYDQNASSPFFDPEWMFGMVNGFDIVIGNPPYAKVQTLQITQSEMMPLYREKYQSAKGSFDIYALFVECGMKLSNKTGQLIYILPHKFFQATFGIELRKMLTKKKAIREIVRFGAEQVFDEATTYTCLMFLSNLPQRIFNLYEVKDLNDNVLNAIGNRTEHSNYNHGQLDSPENENWDFSIGENNKVLQRLQQHKLTLGDITRKIFVGLQTSADKIYVLKIIENLGKTIRCFSNYNQEEIVIEKDFIRPFLMGKDVHRYQKPVPINVVIFPYWIKDKKAILMTQKEIQEHFPLGWNYLNKNKKYLAERENGRFIDSWWCFSRPQNMIDFLEPKIMTPDICNKPELTIDTSDFLYHTTTVFSIVMKEGVLFSHKYLLGLLNSKVMWYFQTQTGTVLRGGFRRFHKQYIEPFPIPDSNQIQQIVIEMLVDYIFNLNLEENNVSPEIKVAVAFFEQLIDTIVYELFFPEEFKFAGGKPSELIYNSLFPIIESTTNFNLLIEFFRKIYDSNHPVRKMQFFIDSIETIRVIESHSKVL